MRTIGRYQIRGMLGKGGMSRVYKAALPAIQKISALKLLAPDPLLVQLMGWDQILRLFEKEAVTMAGVSHPNIVSIHDFDEHQGRPFYVMDFFANNLGTLMGEAGETEKASRIIPTDKALNYACQTVRGIGCLHDAGIIHRDIKPFNLLITDQDTIKIGDFGLSKLRGERYRGPSNLNVGSPFYAAPEQEANPDQVGPRADLYAAGVTLYRMLTGCLPAMDTDRRLPASHFNSDLDEPWDHFFAKAMMPDPQQRYPDAKAFLEALEDIGRHWEKRRENICRLPLTETVPPPKSKIAQPLRSTPLKIDLDDAASEFEIDTLWRPQTYTQNDFQAAPDGTVIDHATGLVWQQSGSDYTRTWQGAGEYIEMLNRIRFAGTDAWRLPTINELKTLLHPPPKMNERCIAPLFDTTQRWIWSSDRRSFISAYYVDTDLGFICWQDFSAPYYVRAVTRLSA